MHRCVLPTVLSAGTTNGYNNQVPTLSSNVGAIDYSVENNISLDYKFFYGEHCDGMKNLNSF